MSTRNSAQIKLRVGQRTVIVKAVDAVGPEDCMDIGLRATIHRYMTREDYWAPVPREAKDFMIKLNLTI
jgi:hypothetical protein